MKHLNKALLVSLLASNLAVGQEATSIEAETVGRLVAEAINSDAQFKISQLENSRALKSAVSKFACSGLEYAYYRIGDVIFVMGKSAQGFVIGRNLKFRVAGRVADIGSISASTKGCLVLPDDPKAVALTVTHLLSDEPTEFHVIANLVSGKTIYVGTESAFWEVSGGHITLIERQSGRDHR